MIEKALYKFLELSQLTQIGVVLPCILRAHQVRYFLVQLSRESASVVDDPEPNLVILLAEVISVREVDLAK